MLYRVLVNLDRWQAGDVSDLKALSAASIEKLIAADCVAPLSSPPLAIFDGWEARAVKLERQGVTEAVQLLEADTADLARKLRVKAAVIENWKSELLGWLTKPQGA